MTHQGEESRLPVVVPRALPLPSEAALALDAALGAVSTTLGAGVALVRATSHWSVVRSRTLWRPALVPTRFQPASMISALADRGAGQRAWAARTIRELFDEWTPVLVELVVSRLDLTDLVKRHVDLDDVVRGVDIEAVIARVDLDDVVQRVDLDAAVAGVDVDAIAGKLDLDAVIDRIDIIALVEEVLAAIDLPSIIRESSGSMASETVRGARMTGIAADDALSRALDRHLFRRRHREDAGAGTEAGTT